MSRQPWKSYGASQVVRALTACLLLGGCGTDDTAPKTSHFEHDHEVAEHWPNDLPDAAKKLRERLVWIETGEVPQYEQDSEQDSEQGSEQGSEQDSDDDRRDPNAEIFDLVSWVPEVAADTNLSEADWLPLYNASESLMANLRASGDGLSVQNQSQIESLCQLIDDAATKIPEQYNSVKVASP